MWARAGACVFVGYSFHNVMEPQCTMTTMFTLRRACAARGQVIALGLDYTYIYGT